MKFLIKLKKKKRIINVSVETKSKNTLQELEVSLNAYRSLGYEIDSVYRIIKPEELLK